MESTEKKTTKSSFFKPWAYSWGFSLEALPPLNITNEQIRTNRNLSPGRLRFLSWTSLPPSLLAHPPGPTISPFLSFAQMPQHVEETARGGAPVMNVYLLAA